MDVLMFLLDNWDVITLLFTNVMALYAKSPIDRKKEKEMLL